MIEPRQNNNTTLTAPTPKNNEIINPLLEKDTISSSNNYYAIWYVVGAYAFSNYLVRVTIGFVAVAMENDLKNISVSYSNKTYDNNVNRNENVNNRKAIILSSFFIGYFINNIFGGLLASKFGGFFVLSIACFAWSFTTAIIPYVFDMSYETTFYLFVNLLFLGISCAPVFPASQVVLSRYTNTANRSIAMSIRSAGASIGAMVGTFLSPYFIYTIGWKNMLKLYGSFGLIVIAISFYYIQEEKKEDNNNNDYNNDGVNKKEEKEDGSKKDTVEQIHSNNTITKETYVQLLRNKSLQSAYICHIAINLTNYTILSYMPTYFVDVLKIELTSTGIYILPSRFAAIAGPVLSGLLVKYILKMNLLSLLSTRKNGAIIVMLSVAFFNFLMPFFQDSPVASSTCLFIITFFMGCFDNFVVASYIDMVPAPELQGFVFGFGNTVAAIPGFLGPFIVTYFLRRFNGSWYPVFWIMSLTLIIASFNHYIHCNVTNILAKSKSMV